MTRYTVGFIFNAECTRVLLMHKVRPEWQKGKVNGIGGHIEEGEKSVDCMVRETQEETGLVTTSEQWTFLGTTHEPKAEVDFYAMRHDGAPDDVRSTTEERIEWFSVNALPSNILSNGPWLVAFAVDRIKNNRGITFDVVYP